MTRWILIAGGVLSALAVLIGAFAAHALKSVLDAQALGWVETGAYYQSTHALALIGCGFLPASKANRRTALFFIVGIGLFSGSLYLMALSGLSLFGIITPLGGVSLVVGWLSFCLAVWAIKD